MEMTFPSIGQRQQATRSCDHKAILARVSARQARSQTVCLVRQAELATRPAGDDVEQRIHYFADPGKGRMAVRGAFRSKVDDGEKSEFGVYQPGLVNFKHPDLLFQTTGEVTNLAGQGTSRTL